MLVPLADAPTISATPTAAAVSGAANREGQSTPTVNPIAQAASTPAAPTAPSHQGGLPQACWLAVTPNTTATQGAEAASIHPVVAGSAAPRRHHAGRGVVVVRSAAPRRPSRDPVQAAPPALNNAKSSTM